MVGGDPAGVRGLQAAYSAAASGGATTGAAFAGAANLVSTGNLAGPAGDQWRAYLADCQKASTVMTHAFEAVGSLLPRVATAVEETQHAEQQAVKAAQEYEQAQQKLAAAQTELAAAEAAASPLSIKANPLSLVTGPSPAQLEAVQAAEAKVTAAQHALTEAEQKLRVARQRFEDDDRRRKALLAELATLCRAQAAAIQAAMPPSRPPVAFGDFSAERLISELTTARTDFLDIPKVASSWLAPVLLPNLERDVRLGPDPSPFLQGPLTIPVLTALASRPMVSRVPHPATHSGGGAWGWITNAAGNVWHVVKEGAPYAGVAVVTLGSVALTVGSDGALAPAAEEGDTGATAWLLRGASQVVRATPKLVQANRIAIGISGLAGETASAANGLVHSGSIDPGAIALAGASSWVTSVVPVGLASKFLGEASTVKLALGRSALSAVTGGGLSAGTELAANGKVDPVATGAATFASGYGAAWPSFGESTPAQVAQALHTSVPIGVPAGVASSPSSKH